MSQAGEIYDETADRIVYCPRCGSELENEWPTECPEHGPVSIDYWEYTDADASKAEWR